ncbi:MAG: S41 family peptidase [Pseudomonadota bacterium]|nr:S41 family peptidase [Pseudomonadota bacterium]
MIPRWSARPARRCLRVAVAVLVALVAVASVPCRAADASPGAPLVSPVQWRQAAEGDLRAAHDLLAQNHPGAVPALHDTAFIDALERGYRDALAQAASVTSYEGYQAVLARYADGFGDGHIWSRPLYLPARLNWAGLLIAKRGDRWIVADEDPDDPATPLRGWQLVDCDGMPVDDFGRRSLGTYMIDWSVGAQQIQAAPWLLVNAGNPFVPKPKACRFTNGGATRTLTLSWRSLRRDVLMPRIAALTGSGAAGFGVRKAGRGYWIALQSLDTGAPAVVAQVAAQKEAMRQADFVVLDLRGNGGGGSLFGRQIAQSLLGDAYVAARLGGEDQDDCGDVWRASPGNIAQLDKFLVELGPVRGPEFVKVIGDIKAKAQAASAAKAAFTGPVSCRDMAARAPADRAAVAPAMRGRLVLLTDNACFSSCLAVTDDYLHLGALQVGQTTDACTHYTEVRQIVLPSGFSVFSTLQALAPSAPRRLGPFAPVATFDGDIADTRAVEAWVVALPQLGKNARD